MSSPSSIPAASNATLGESGRSRLPAVVYLLGAVAFLMGTTEMIVAGLLPDIAGDLNVTESQAGLLITVFAIGMMIGAPITALATLRLPKRSTLALALVVFAAGHLIAAVSDSFTVELAARFISAVATGTFWAVGATVAAAAAGEAASARAMGVMVGGVTVANIIGVPVGSLAGQAIGWHGPFLILGVLGVVAAGVVAWRIPADDASARTSPSASVREELRSVADRRVWLIYSAIALAQGATLACYSYVSPLVTDRAGLPSSAVPFVMLGYGMGAIVGTTVGGRFGDRRPFSVIIPVVGLLTAVLAALSMWASVTPVTIGLIVLLGFAGLVPNPILVSQTVRRAGQGRALAVALSTSSFNVGIAAGSWLGGIALDSSLQGRGPSLVGVALALLALAPLSVLARNRTGKVGAVRVDVREHPSAPEPRQPLEADDLQLGAHS